MACFNVDNDTAENFREAVRIRYGKGAWGKIKQELEKAMNDHAQSLLEGKRGKN